MEKQDGGIGRHTAPPRTTRTDRKIQTSRRGRDRHQGGEDSRCRVGTQTGRVWDERGRQSDH